VSSPGQATVRRLPLGGLGEIGMNCLALEQRDEILVVDCGVAFPHDDLGVDVIHPDFSWLTERADRVRGLILTHGHEDHIGAVPYLLSRMHVPVVGPPHAVALVEHRLAEHPLSPGDVELRTVVAGQTVQFGDFLVEPIRVSHSIVEATALRIETDAGTIVHTGDFNFDAAPPDGEPTDVTRLESVAGSGVGLLLSDSTNIDVPEKTHGEREVGLALEAVIGAQQRA
jgi:ribonuclease J